MLDKQKLYKLTLQFPDSSLDSHIEVYDLIHDEKESYKLFKAWHAYFVAQDFSLDLIAKYFDTYWKWYVMVSWKNFGLHSEQTLVEIMPHQFMMAFRLGHDVSSLYPNQIVSFIPEDSVQDAIHASIVDQITNSTVPFDYHKGESIASLIKNIKNTQLLDEFERSDIYARIEAFFFEENESSTGEEKLDRILSFINFIDFITDKKAMAIFRELFTQTAEYLPDSPVDSIYNEIVAGTSVVGGSDESGAVASEAPEKENIFVSIRDQISRGLKNISGDSDEYILLELQKFSEQYNNAQILDLYYFDEQANRFVWNNDLLSET